MATTIDEFLAVLSHELRNPLAPIRNSLEILRLGGDRPEVLESQRAVIDRQVRRIVHLADVILDVSRISSNAISPRKQRVELTPLINEVIEGHRPLIDRYELTLTWNPPAQPIWLNADPVRLAQVISQLISNAVSYNKPGGRITITVETEPLDSIVRIQVRDEGIGIAADELPGLFNLFTDVATSHATSRRGLGVGLPLARHLVSLHDGTIEAASEGPDLGSTFTVRLPMIDTPLG